MLRSMKEIVEGKTTEVLKERKKEVYRKILHKQKLIDRHSLLLVQMEGNCSDLITEYEMIDRTVFFRESRISIISSRQKEEKPKLPIEKETKKLTREEASGLLRQLLALKESRQSCDSE
jgi:hypothetical protein